MLGGTDSGPGATRLAPEVEVWRGLLVETILTFFLVNTVYNAAIGLTLTFSILMGVPLTGASLDPARTIGPDVLTGDFSDIWIYIVGPILGGILAALLYKYLLKPTD